VVFEGKDCKKFSALSAYDMKKQYQQRIEEMDNLKNDYK
jgi:hypothetical protein